MNEPPQLLRYQSLWSKAAAYQVPWLVCKDGRAPGQTQGFTFSIRYPMSILRDKKKNFLSPDPLIFLAESRQ